MTGGIVKAVCDKRRRRRMREFLAQKGRIEITTSYLMYWEAVDKMMDNPSPTVLFLVN